MKRRAFLTSLFAAPVVASVQASWFTRPALTLMEWTHKVERQTTADLLDNLDKFIQEMRLRPYLDPGSWPRGRLG